MILLIFLRGKSIIFSEVIGERVGAYQKRL